VTDALTTTVDTLLDDEPFSLSAADKHAVLLPALNELTRHHYARCEPYSRVVDAVFGGLRAHYDSIADLPFVPVSLFKETELRSIAQEDVFRVLTSSGTTGQGVSRVFLDQQTSGRQAKALVRIMQHFLGKQRLPMVILDHPDVVKNRTSFSARGAGVLGLMQFGRQPIYAFRSDMSFDFEAVEKYLLAHRGQPVLFFGFTFMVWQHGVAALQALSRKLPATRGILIHSGGWKKLESSKVDAATFNHSAREILGVERVINFYGMVEQVGSVFFENELRCLHTPVFADVIVRDPFTLQALPAGRRGLIQVVSVLPQSYPGHSLLTEDLGEWVGADDPGAGMPGRFFRVHGRAPRSEVRGCSDTYVQPN
jgi:hypothetical protein